MSRVPQCKLVPEWFHSLMPIYVLGKREYWDILPKNLHSMRRYVAHWRGLCYQSLNQLPDSPGIWIQQLIYVTVNMENARIAPRKHLNIGQNSSYWVRSQFVFLTCVTWWYAGPQYIGSHRFFSKITLGNNYMLMCQEHSGHIGRYKWRRLGEEIQFNRL